MERIILISEMFIIIIINLYFKTLICNYYENSELLSFLFTRLPHVCHKIKKRM